MKPKKQPRQERERERELETLPGDAAADAAEAVPARCVIELLPD